ncbi:hypothetical protein [Siphonobacter sp. SORGH_AS_0500]|uniref:hypothetical protein n=1 Tax=Siphonobacter sp. SORGH_AS_0500 TaxID=1864824 RepID=UPI00285693B6|nr:hypothetical protein [Siphonobacter sp. SORGH_AS_0500]MDR6196179.1 5S rRNA maturation endonuclease (ribonuclease M5) [Siphonobacter sp. SORGH_AS_0500]
MIEIDDIMREDGGLRFILSRYPDANEKKAFKVRGEEKTASARMKCLEDGVYVVTDFGSDSKPRNAIAICELEDRVDYGTAIKTVAAFYGVVPEKQALPKPDVESRPAGPEEPEGYFDFEEKEFDLHELLTIYSRYAWEALGANDDKRIDNGRKNLHYYRWKCLKSFTKTKKDEKTGKLVTRKISSNERFPIFMIDEGKFKKIYKPKDDKKYRFQYEPEGNYEKDYIHGLDQHRKFLIDLNAKADQDYDKADEEGKEEKRKDAKLQEIIICSGGSDAVNVAALGFKVIWMNSETAFLRPELYRELMKMADAVYLLNDIDPTGIKATHNTCMHYLELRGVFLPDSLREKRDQRGNPCKDVRDYLKYYNQSAFRRLLSTSYPYQFWDVEQAVDAKTGKVKYKYGRPMMEFKPNPLRIYNFLHRNGFSRLKWESANDGKIFVRAENNIVRVVNESDLRDFINDFLEERMESEDLRNTFYRATSGTLANQSLANLPFKDLDFQNYGQDYQYYFFDKKTWKVTAKAIEEVKQSESECYVWQDKVMRPTVKVNREERPVKVEILPDMFRVKHMPNGKYDIDILDNDCIFFNYLIQTCRIHWRREWEERIDIMTRLNKTQQAEYFEGSFMSPEEAKRIMAVRTPKEIADYKEKHQFDIAGPLLTMAEQEEQKQHLVNRLFVIGYVLHRYKFASRPWVVYSMDGKLAEDGESHGGTGKSILTKAIKKFLKVTPLPGTGDAINENDFVFEKVKEDTDLVLIDDMDSYVRFRKFYEPATSDWVINRKGRESNVLDFQRSPKIWMNSNFGDRYTEPSDIRRKIYTVFSDWYHEDDGSGEYNGSHSPKIEFGVQNILEDVSEVQCLKFYNLMIQCVKFYLSCEDKIDPPLDNVNRRNLLSEMGENFHNWAEVYFHPASGNLNQNVVRTDAQESYWADSRAKGTPQLFKKKMQAWCRYNGYELNPSDLIDKQGRIMYNNKECFHVRTPKPATNSDIPF